MADKYEVIRPWHGVKKGAIVEFEKVHPSLESHVRLIPAQAAPVLKPAVATLSRKEKLTKRLTDLGIEFDGRMSANDLAALLPDGEAL